MEPMKRTQAERSETTRMKLLSVARALFAEQGYADTPLDLVAERSGLTKGALYHHFRNKRDLFQAVFEQLEGEMCDKVVIAALAHPDDALASMHAGVRAFMESALDPAAQRIVLIEGPTVLGWDTWREIDERYGYGLTKASIDNAMDKGVLEQRPSEPLARLFLAALSEAALQVARADDKERALEEMTAAVMSILDGMRIK
jgi:AcrR family transcriptional regulator